MRYGHNQRNDFFFFRDTGSSADAPVSHFYEKRPPHKAMYSSPSRLRSKPVSYTHLAYYAGTILNALRFALGIDSGKNFIIAIEENLRFSSIAFSRDSKKSRYAKHIAALGKVL